MKPLILISLLACLAIACLPAAADTTTITSTTIASITTLGDIQVPTPPASLTALAVSANQVNLAWSAATDNVGVTAYKVYRNSNLAASLGNVTSYNDTPLTAGTTYSCTVKACDAAGNCSAQSSSTSATTSWVAMGQRTISWCLRWKIRPGRTGRRSIATAPST